MRCGTFPSPRSCGRWRRRNRRVRPAQHEPHRPHVVAGVSPVPLGVDVAEPQLPRLPSLIRAAASVTLRVTNSMPRSGLSWLNRIPERGMDAEALAVVHRGPMRENLRGGIRASGDRTACFRSARLLRLAEHFRGRRLIKAGLGRGNAQASSTFSAPVPVICAVSRADRGGGDKGLSREVVHLIRLSILHDANEAGKIDKVPVIELDLVRDVQPAHADGRQRPHARTGGRPQPRDSPFRAATPTGKRRLAP